MIFILPRRSDNIFIFHYNILIFIYFFVISSLFMPAAIASERCVPDDTWIDPVNHEMLTFESVMHRLADTQVVFLGEHHQNVKHHEWHLSMLSALHSKNSNIELAIEMGADAVDLGHTIHPHPTLSETVNFAAEMFEGTITDLMPPKKRK